jgi:NTE family protein
VALALGAGGARGYAHIGAIQVLEERGLEIATVAGSSMGAVVGGIYAAGKLGEFTHWALGLTQREVLRLLDLSFTSPGAIRAEKVLARVRELIGPAMIEDLEIPFTAVATDLLTRREVLFQRGPLDLAIRASIALPGIFTPVMLDGRLLADGGLMDPIPIAPTSSVASDLTIAISLGGERQGPRDPAAGHDAGERRPVDAWVGRFRRGAAQAIESELVRSAFSWRARSSTALGGEHAPPEPSLELDTLPAGLSRFDVMNYALEAMQAVVASYRLAGFPPDVLVNIPRDACRTLDFHHAESMIDLGRALTAQALDNAGIGGEDPRPGAPTD